MRPRGKQETRAGYSARTEPSPQLRRCARCGANDFPYQLETFARTLWLHKDGDRCDDFAKRFRRAKELNELRAHDAPVEIEDDSQYE